MRDKINNDLKSALKEGKDLEVQVLRMLMASLQNRMIEKRGKGESEELSNEEVVEILQRELKKRREAADLYRQGNRAELAEVEEKEAVIIQKYLPEQMSEEEIGAKVDEILRSAQDDLSFGEVIKQVMAELKGKADGKKVAEIIKKRLEE